MSDDEPGQRIEPSDPIDPIVPPAEQEVRSMRLAAVGVGLVVVTLLVVAVFIGIAIERILGDDDQPGEPEADVWVEGVESPVGLTVAADGGLLFVENELGTVRRVSPEGVLDPEPVAVFDVMTGGQRGIFSVVELPAGPLAVSYVRASDGRIVVERTDGDLAWEGPIATDLANSGHLELARDGRLVIGIGDLQDRASLDDISAPNGKLLSFDRHGVTPTACPLPDCEPAIGILSMGWNNPFAFDVGPDGAIWVADNAPGDDPERLGRGDANSVDLRRADLDGVRAPSGLVVLDDGRMLVCGFVSGQLDLFSAGPEPELERRAIAACTHGVAVLDDGRIVTATETQLLIRPPLDD